MTSLYRTWPGPSPHCLSDRQIWALQYLPPGMLRLWLIGMALVAAALLAGCQGAPAQTDMQTMLSDPRVQLAVACQGYAGAMNTAAAAISADKLSSSNVERVLAIRAQFGPACEKQDAAQDPAVLAAAVTTAATQIAATFAVPPDSKAK